MPRLLALLLLLCAGPLLAEDPKGDEKPASVAPSWSVGDWWKVQCHPLAGVQPKRPTNEPSLTRDKSTVVTVTFTVVEVRTVGGNRCFAIEMTNDQFEKEKVTFVIRASNLTVKQIETTTDGENSSTLENPAKTYVHQDTGLLIPLDFPRLPREGKDETVADTIGTTTREFIQTTKFAADGRKATVEIKTEINGKPLVSTQVWEQGRPWWTSAKRVYDGAEMESGTLVDWSGKQD